jgi:hypothetical protein
VLTKRVELVGDKSAGLDRVMAAAKKALMSRTKARVTAGDSSIGLRGMPEYRAQRLDCESGLLLDEAGDQCQTVGPSHCAEEEHRPLNLSGL